MRRLLILLLLVSSASMAAKIPCSVDMFSPLTLNDNTLQNARCISSEIDMGQNAMSSKYLATAGAAFMMFKMTMFEGNKVTNLMQACSKAERPGWYLCTGYWYDANAKEWHKDPNHENEPTSVGDIADAYFSSLLVKPADERYLFFGDNPPWAN